MATLVAGDGVALFAEAHGHGIPVVFSCALCTTHANWRPQVESLVAAGARVILWDYRGHGRSAAPADPDAYSLEQVVDDLGRVLDWAAPAEPAVLAGLSFGGLASLHFTVRHRERVRGLLLIDSGPGFKNPEAQAKWTRATERAALFIELINPKRFQKTIHRFIGRPLSSAAPFPPASRRLRCRSPERTPPPAMDE